MDEIYLGNWSAAKNPGETPSWGELEKSSYDSAQTYQNANAWQRQEEAEIDKLNLSIEKAGGKALPNPWRIVPTADDYKTIRDKTISDGRPVMLQKYFHDKYEADLLALGQSNPALAALIRPETVPSYVVGQRMQATEKSAADISERRGFVDAKALPVVGGVPLVRDLTATAINTARDPYGMSAQLVGGLRGTWSSPGDIVANLLPFGAGKASMSIVKNALLNAVSNAGLQAVLEPGVQSNRAKGGLEYGIGPAMEDIAGAFATGAVLDVAVRGPMRAYNRRVEPQFRIGEARAPDTQFGGVFKDAPPLVPEPPAPKVTIDPEVMKKANDGDIPALRQIAEQTRILDDNPEIRAALDHAEATGRLEDAVSRFRDEMRTRNGVEIDAGELNRQVAAELRAAIDPDALPMRREPATVRQAAEPLMEAEAAQIIAERADDIDRLVTADLEPRIARLVSDGLNAGLAPIVRAVREAIGQPAERQPQTIAKAVEKLSEDLGGPERLQDTLTLHSGRGSPVEVAAAMRRSPDLVDSNVSFATDFMQGARSLSTLDDIAWAMVARGEAQPHIAKLVADHVEPGRQAGVLDRLMRAGIDDAGEARKAIADLEPVRIPERVKGIDDPNGPEVKAETERMEQHLAPEAEAARKAIPDPSPGETMLETILQAAVVRRGAEAREAIIDAIALASRILPEGSKLRLEAGEMRSPEGHLLDAQSDVTTGDITLATYAMNPAGRIGHEGVHTLVTRGLLSPDEVKLLAEAAGKTEVKAEGPAPKDGEAPTPETVFPDAKRQQYADAYADRPNLDALLDEEAAAHLIEATINGKAKPEDAPRGIVERLQKLFEAIAERLKNWKDGRGWQTADDLINDILSGEVAKREAVKAWMRGEDISAMAVRKPNRLGPVALHRLREAMRKDFPDATEFSGWRMSGSRRGPAARGDADPVQSVRMFALSDRETGQSMRRDFDALGFYSQALEAARSLKQAKGTPEQMLAQLKSAGVKDAEIKATGLLNWLNERTTANSSGGSIGNKVHENVSIHSSKGGVQDGTSGAGVNSRSNVVTKDEIVRFLDGNRVGLTEVEYGVSPSYVRDQLADRRLGGAFAQQGPLDQADIAQQAAQEIAQGRWSNPERGTKWQSYSLDPSNPSYRETVLHLPSAEHAAQAKVDRISNRMDNLESQGRMSEFRRMNDAYEAAVSARSQLGPDTSFRSGHFPEPNIVGHTMSSMVKHEGRPTYLLDQIQSDWGQKVRDGGVRDEAKIAGLSRELDAIKSIKNEFSAYRQAMADKYGNIHPSELPSEERMRFEAIKAKVKEAEDRRPLISAEHKTALAATPGHPLVNTTDQWVNTTLRRSIRQAAEAGADYIAIPHGDTVLSYNPGDEHGMRSFYGAPEAAYYAENKAHFEKAGNAAALKELTASGGPLEGIVPKNLRKLLERLDKNTPKPERVETLETPSGRRGYRPDSRENFDKNRTGFTLFPITDTVKEKVKGEGQAMFALSDYFLDSPLDDLARRNGATLISKIRPWQRQPRGSVLAFHSTNASFDRFDISKANDLGLHFGTPDHANRLSSGKSFKGAAASDAARTIPAVLDIRNPITLPDLGDWEPWKVLREIENQGVAVPSDLKKLARNPKADQARLDARVRNLLIDAGYDGVRYLNLGEGYGLGWSYIAIKAGTVKSALSNNSMFAFAGEKARTADLDALAQAKQMEADGPLRVIVKGAPGFDAYEAARTKTFQATGWWLKVDGKWSFETDDSKAKFRRDPGKAANLAARVGYENVSDLFDNESLFSAYPDMGQAQLVLRGQYGGAYYDKATMSTIGVGKDRFEVSNNEFSPSDPRSILLHEMQHKVQGTEGFARGTSLDDATKQAPAEWQAMQDAYAASEADSQRFRDLIEEKKQLVSDPKSRNTLGEIKRSVNKQIDALNAEIEALKPRVLADDRPFSPTPRRLYDRFAGEVEARAVQMRMNLTAEQRRARPPWLDYDVPEEQQIVRFANGTGLSMYAFSEEQPPVDGFSMRGLKLFAIRAWHGSPHDFDRFELKFIGTGEGAQAYGHGLYFAENEGVARQYRDDLSQGQAPKVGGQDLDLTNPVHYAADAVARHGDLAFPLLRRAAGYEPEGSPKRAFLEQAAGIAQRGNVPDVVNGRIYEVNIHADPDDFLDWDRPLSQQSERVRGALSKADLYMSTPEYLQYAGGDLWPTEAAARDIASARGMKDAQVVPRKLWNGRNGYSVIVERPIGENVKKQVQNKDIAATLRDAGLAGIRYLDQGSRASGEGSRNYVVFDDKLIEIVAKDGKPVEKADRDAVLSGMKPDDKMFAISDEPNPPLSKDIQDADRLVEAAWEVRPKEGGQAMFALRDPNDVIDELERKSTLGKKEAADARKKIEHLKGAGMSDDEVLDTLATELEKAGERRKFEAFKGETARQRIISDLISYRNHKGETDLLEAWKRIHEKFDTTGSYIEDLETARVAIEMRAAQKLSALMKEFKRGAITGDMRRRFGKTYAKGENVVRELHGEKTGDEAAALIAKAVAEVFEELRQRFNKAGGHIAKLEHWFPQAHDAQALRDFKQGPWVEYMMGDDVLDRERMVSPLTGRKLTDGELREALMVSWARITTDGWVDKEVTGQPMGRGALFNQHADHRFIHFKNADAAMAYARKFGNPDPYATIQRHIAVMARDIAHMERLGPNPQMMRTYIRNWLTARAASTGSVESQILEQRERLAQIGIDHADALKDLMKDRQQLLDELAERYLDMERVKMRSAIKRAVGLKDEQEKRLAELDARTRRIDEMLYDRGKQKDLLSMDAVMVRQKITDAIDAMREAVELSSDKDPQAALNRTLNRVDAMWELQRGALVPVSTKFANIMAIGRNIISADSLGAAVISSITDPAYGSDVLKRWGMSFGRSNAGTVLAGTLKQMLRPNAKWEALDSSIAMSTAMSAFQSQAKANKSWLPWLRDMSGYVNDRVLSIGLLTPWTEAGKAYITTKLQLNIGRHAHLPFEKLPVDIRKGLKANGFDAESWQAIRMSQLYDPQSYGPATRDSKAKQLRPKEIEQAAGMELAERYIAMLVRESRHGVIETTVESRAMMIGTTRPGTIPGEAVRSMGQFKGFPLAVAFMVLGRLAREIGAGDYRSAAKHASALAISSAFLGFIAMALKDMKDGRDPRRLLDEKTWLAWDTWAAAMLQAGGLGIFGDFFFSNVNRHGGGLSSTIGGPMVDRIDNIRELTVGNAIEAIHGKDTHFGREGVRFLRQNVPGISSWPIVSMAWNRIFMDELQRMVDPKAHDQFRAQIMNRRRDYGGQEYFWAPGQTRPDRLPDLSRAFATH